MKIRICGVDSVGIGPLAGPVVACAVIFKKLGVYPIGLNDSKKLTPKQREQLVPKIKKMAFYGLGRVGPKVIDRINIYRADSLAMERAIKNLRKRPSVIYVDGKHRKLHTKYPYVCIVRGDETVAEIMASSILAKVWRDNLMAKHSKKYPQYLWQQNRGYGTLFHISAVKQYGISPYHRKSYKPIAEVYGNELSTEYIMWKEALHSCSIEGNALARKVLKKIKRKNIKESLKIIKENFGNGKDK